MSEKNYNLNLNLNALLFASKEHEVKEKARNIKKLAFVLLAGRKDQYSKYLSAILEKIIEALKLHNTLLESSTGVQISAASHSATTTSTTASATAAAAATTAGGLSSASGSVAYESLSSPLLQSIFLCFRVLLLRCSAEHLSSFWPVAICEALRVFEARKENMQLLDASVLLSAAKFVELAILLLPQQFFIYQWIFIRDYILKFTDPAIHGHVQQSHVTKHQSQSHTHSHGHSHGHSLTEEASFVPCILASSTFLAPSSLNCAIEDLMHHKSAAAHAHATTASAPLATIDTSMIARPSLIQRILPTSIIQAGHAAIAPLLAVIHARLLQLSSLSVEHGAGVLCADEEYVYAVLLSDFVEYNTQFIDQSLYQLFTSPISNLAPTTTTQTTSTPVANTHHSPLPPTTDRSQGAKVPSIPMNDASALMKRQVHHRHPLTDVKSASTPNALPVATSDTHRTVGSTPNPQSRPVNQAHPSSVLTTIPSSVTSASATPSTTSTMRTSSPSVPSNGRGDAPKPEDRPTQLPFPEVIYVPKRGKVAKV